LVLVTTIHRRLQRAVNFALPAAFVVTLAGAISACGGDTLGVATTVVPVQPTDFATIPPVSSTAPGSTTTLPPNAVGSEQTYTVQAGDSPIAVANKYGISVTTLLAYNGWVSTAQFPYPGETIRIPPQAVATVPQVVDPATGATTAATSAPDPALAGCGTRPAGSYTVQPNDSIFKIRKKFCVSTNALLAANNWSDIGTVVLLIGDVINIPAAGQ
jgi:LysM repeat protein